MNMKVRNPVFPILFGIVFFVLLIPFIYTLLLSTKDYKIIMGLFGSPFTGAENFNTLLGSPYFPMILRNTFAISIISLFFGAVYVFFASMAIGGIANRWIKAVVAVIFAIPALIPVTFARFFFPEAILTAQMPGYQLVAGLLGGLRLAGLVSVVSVFTKGDVLKQGLKTTLLFVALKSVTFFSPDISISLNSYNPLIYEVADTLATFMYRTGLLESNFSFSATVGMLRMILQLVLAIPMVFVLKYVMSEEKDVKPHQPVFGIFSISAIVPIIILLAALILCGSLLPDDVIFAPYYANSLMICIPTAILVAFISYGVSLLGRNSGIFGIIGIAALCALTGNLISEYMITRQLGLLNTHMAVIAGNLKLVPVISMLFMFATKNDRSIKNDMSAIIIMAFVVFAWTWGDSFTDSIFLHDREKFTTSLCIREISLHNNPAYTATSPMTSAPLILIPVIVAFVCGVLSALLDKSSEPEVK